MVSQFNIEAVIGAIRSVIGEQPAILHEPFFQGNEEKYVVECIRTGWVSSVGSFVNRFEEMLQDITGARKAVAVSNGTSGLFIALKLAGVKEAHEVLMPAFTFVATANAVAHCNAIPHFVDIEDANLGIDPEKLRDYLHDITVQSPSGLVNRLSGRIISAIVPMHTFGHPAKIESLLEVADEFGIPVVEDAAESLGSYVSGRHTGTFGKLAMISFNGNKIATTGGGGAILTNDVKLGERAKHLTTTAKLPHAWRFQHDEVGYNFRLPNLNAALGCAQLEQLDSFVKTKRGLAERYNLAFREIAGATIVLEPKNCQSNYWLNSILLEEPLSEFRDELIKATNENKIMTRPAWDLMHELSMYKDSPRSDLSVSKYIYDRLINIPSGVGVASGG